MEIQFPHSIDSTMMSTYDSCAQKFLIEYLMRKAPSGKSIHLHAGGCFASAMENIRNFYYKDKMNLEEAKARAFPKFVQQWGWFDPPEGSYKDFTNMWAAVEAYFDEYPPETDHFQPFIKDDGSPAVEFRFALPTEVLHPETGDPILFAGRADMLAQNDPHSCYVMDEKTTNALGTRWVNQWDMRGQFYGYTYAARAHGFPCAGAIVRGVAIQQTKFGFAEKLLYYTNNQLDWWWETFNQKLSMLVAQYRMLQETLNKGWPEGTTYDEILTHAHQLFARSYGDACGSYGGCQYVDVCTKAEPWNFYKHMETRIWDPLAHDPTAESEDRLSEMGEISFEEAMRNG